MNRIKYEESIKTALASRNETDIPRFGTFVAMIVVFTGVFCIAGFFAVPEGKLADFHFQEGGAITTLSALYLAVGAGFAIAANLVHLRVRGSSQWIWVVVAAGLAFLAFDELFQFHERFGRIVVDRVLPRMIFRNWNDAIVILYGISAIPVIVYFLPRILKYRLLPEFFLAAFFLYALHTIIDSTQEPPTVTTIAIEESAKLGSTLFLMLGALVGFFGNLWEWTRPGLFKSDVSPIEAQQKLPGVSTAHIATFDG